MNMKWVAAGLAALCLAILTLPALSTSVREVLNAGRSTQSGSASPGGEASGDACPADAKPANFDFTLRDMHGKDVNLADYKGKVIVLDFWATWCGPCKVEIPAFVELQNTYRDQGLVVLGFSVDDTVDQLKPFVEEFKMNYPVLVGNGRDEVQDAYGPIWGLPTTVLIGRNGKICKRHTGLTTKDKFESDIKSLL